MIIKKMGVAVLSLLVAACCTFGYMECFEPGAAFSGVFKVVYVVTGVGCLAAAIWYATRTPGKR